MEGEANENGTMAEHPEHPPINNEVEDVMGATSVDMAEEIDPADDIRDDKGTENDERKKRGRPKKQSGGLSGGDEDLNDTRLKMQVTKLQNEKCVLKKQIEKFKQEIADQTARLINLQLEQNVMISDNQRLLADYETQRNITNEVSEERMKLQDELDVSLSNTAKLKKELVDSRGEFNELEKITSGKIVTLKKDLKQANTNLANEKRLAKDKITKLETDNAKLKMHIEELTEKVTDAAQSLETSENETEKLRQLLCESENEKCELLEQLDSSVLSGPDFFGPKPRGMVVYDNVTKSLVEKLGSNINWQPIKSSLDLPESLLGEMAGLDIILFLTGSEDIRGGAKGAQVFSKLKLVLSKLADHTKIVVAELPPTSIRGAAAQITLFNFKLAKISEIFPNVVYIASNPKAVLRNELLDENDDLSESAISSIAKELSNISPPENIKPHFPCAKEASNSTASISDSSYKLTELIQLQQRQIGRVIGIQGSTITKLSKKHSVTLRIGKWSEPKRDNRTEMENKMDGVIITGLINNVTAAADEVRSIISRGDDSPNPKK